MLKSSTTRAQSERKHRRNKNWSPKHGQLELPTETQKVLKQNDGQGTVAETRMFLKPTTSRHYTVSTENSDDGSSSDMEIYESGWHSQPNPTTSLSDNPTRRKSAPKDSDSASSSSIEECKSSWKLQSQPTSHRHKIKKKNTRIQSTSNNNMFETLWQPQTKTTTSVLKKSVQRKTALKQNSDSESSSSLNDIESSWKPHSKSTSSRHKIFDRNTSEKSSANNKFKETWNQLATPCTSLQKNKKQIKDGRNYGGANTCRTTPRELTKLSTNQQRSFNHNSRRKFTETGRLNTYATQNLTVPWEPSRQVQPNFAIVSDLHPSGATSSATHLGQLGNQQKCSVLKKSDVGVQRNSFVSNSTLSGIPSKSLGRNMFAEVITSARRSPRKRSHTPVYNAKKKMCTDELARNGGSHNRHRSPKIVHRGSEKRRQLLQYSGLAPPSISEELDNSVDNSESHSPLVRGKTRSRTRYYSTVGAVCSPPTPTDYTQWREWPADVGLVYAEYPRDFVGSGGPRFPWPPTGDRQVSVHHALHCAIAIVAFTTAASRHQTGILAGEISLALYLLGKMADFVRWETPGESYLSVNSQTLHHGMENMQITEYTDMESMLCSKNTFLDMFGLGKADNVTTPPSAAEEEIIWLKTVRELILHVEHIISQQYEKPCSADEKGSSPGLSAQHRADATGGEMVLVKYLNQLLLATSLLYSVVCHTPHESVKNYIDSQTPELVTQWMKDMLTDNP